VSVYPYFPWFIPWILRIALGLVLAYHENMEKPAQKNIKEQRELYSVDDERLMMAAVARFLLDYHRKLEDKRRENVKT
jgi:hypothetical protein